MTGNNATTIPHGAAATPGFTLLGDGFWPEISSNDFRDQMRVDRTVTDARIRAALINAVMAVMADAQAFQTANAVHTALADIPASIIDGDSVLIHHFRAAVFNEAKASLVETHRDIDSTQSGHDEADRLEPTICDYRRLSREAVRGLIGKPRATITIL